MFVFLPSGYGKSLCYMLLPLVFDNLRSEHCHRKSVAVVVSPLIALMEDQVASYSAKGLKSAFITSESDNDTKTAVSDGVYQIVLFSPEALISNQRWRNMLREEPYSSSLVALIIDEAHCVKNGMIFKTS